MRTTTMMTELFDVLDLCQYVNEPTRSNPDHLLDVIAADSALPVNDVRVVDTGSSDHKLVAAAVGASKAAPPPITIPCRNIRQIDTVDFERRLRLSSLSLHQLTRSTSTPIRSSPLSPPFWTMSHPCVMFADDNGRRLHTGCLRTPSKRSAIADDSRDSGRSRASSLTVLLTASRVDTPTN